MYCPGCAVQIVDESKFCKQCGANLLGVREAMLSRGKNFDWSAWAAELVMSEEERDRRRGITPERKRINEVKNGVITTAVGIGIMIFLRFFFEAIAHQSSPKDAEVVSRLWLCGMIPFLIGVAMIFNAYVFEGRSSNKKERPMQMPPQSMPVPSQLEAKTTNQLSEPTDFSITEDPTEHLPRHAPLPSRRESS